MEYKNLKKDTEVHNSITDFGLNIDLKKKLQKEKGLSNLA